MCKYHILWWPFDQWEDISTTPHAPIQFYFCIRIVSCILYTWPNIIENSVDGEMEYVNRGDEMVWLHLDHSSFPLSISYCIKILSRGSEWQTFVWGPIFF